jgi:hypothetical protein
LILVSNTNRPADLVEMAAAAEQACADFLALAGRTGFDAKCGTVIRSITTTGGAKAWTVVLWIIGVNPSRPMDKVDRLAIAAAAAEVDLPYSFQVRSYRDA